MQIVLEGTHDLDEDVSGAMRTVHKAASLRAIMEENVRSYSLLSTHADYKTITGDRPLPARTEATPSTLTDAERSELWSLFRAVRINCLI